MVRFGYVFVMSFGALGYRELGECQSETSRQEKKEPYKHIYSVAFLSEADI